MIEGVGCHRGEGVGCHSLYHCAAGGGPGGLQVFKLAYQKPTSDCLPASCPLHFQSWGRSTAGAQRFQLATPARCRLRSKLTRAQSEFVAEPSRSGGCSRSKTPGADQQPSGRGHKPLSRLLMLRRCRPVWTEHCEFLYLSCPPPKEQLIDSHCHSHLSLHADVDSKEKQLSTTRAPP